MILEKQVCDCRNFAQPLDKAPKIDKKLAVQIHIYYTDLIPELTAALKNICHRFDLFVTTDTAQKAAEIEEKLVAPLKTEPFLENAAVEVCGNRGRDVIPFLQQLRPVYRQYAYILHLHTKKSKHSEIGDAWRRHLYRLLLGDRTTVDNVMGLFEEDPSVGLVYPQTFAAVLPFMRWDENRKVCQRVAKAAGIEIRPFKVGRKEIVVFPAGDMFWARTEAVYQLLDCPFTQEQIPPEEGQLDGTIMHAIERLWTYTAKFNGYCTVLMETDFVEDCVREEIDRRQRSIVDKLLPFGTRRRAAVRWVRNLFRK